MALVLAHSKLSGAQRTVLLSIANHMGEQGAWPSIKTMAREANCSERTVQRAITAAVAAGELEVLDQDGGDRNTPGNRRPNRYHLLLACPPECDGSANHRRRPERGDIDVTPTPAPNPTRGDTHVTPEPARGDIYDTLGVTQVSPKPSIEPLLLPSVSPETTDRAPTRRTDGPAAPDELPPAAGPDGPPTDPRLADPGFLRFLAAAVPAVRRPERFTWPPGELDALEARWRSPDPFAAHHRQAATSTPPKFDPTLHGPPPDAIPMPDHVRALMRRPA